MHLYIFGEHAYMYTSNKLISYILLYRKIEPCNKFYYTINCNIYLRGILQFAN